MDDLKDQSAVSTTATNGVVESEEVRAQEALLGDTDPSLTSADDVAKALNVDPSHGLSEEEAKRRLAKFGPNELASAPPVPKWKKFLAQFQDPLVYLLIAATIISVIAWLLEKANAQPGAEGGEVLPFDAIVIILILIVNAVLGYMQEAKAEAAVEALAQMTAPQTSVLRDDKVMRINTADVVPGDIIVLAEGDSVSADGRLVNAASLRIAEASLTGESVPVGKKPDTLTEAKALGDRANMIFNGTSVTQGTGRTPVIMPHGGVMPVARQSIPYSSRHRAYSASSPCGRRAVCHCSLPLRRSRARSVHWWLCASTKSPSCGRFSDFSAPGKNSRAVCSAS